MAISGQSGPFKKMVKNLVPFLFQIYGGSILSNDDAKKLGISMTPIASSKELILPSVPDYNSQSDLTIPEKKLYFPSTHLIRLDYHTYGDCLRRWGNVVLSNSKILQTGTDANLARLSVFFPKKRLWGKKRTEQIIVAPWPHLWSTYGDFLFYMFPKLCRIVGNMTLEEKAQAVILLPFNRMGNWAKQYVELLGFPENRQIDSEKESVSLSKDGILITGDGPLHSQAIAHPDDIKIMQHLILGDRQNESTCLNPGKIFFISRKGTRKLLNEKELYHSIESFNVELIEDVPRTAKQQIELFKDAELIIGAHGAGLCNALWGRSSASVMEVQGTQWALPSFRAWCAMRNTPYGVFYDRSEGDELSLNHSSCIHDLQADPVLFRKGFESILALKTTPIFD